MADRILCISIETDETPPLIGEVSEFEQMLQMIFGNEVEIPDGEQITVKFERLTPEEYQALPDWGP